MKILAFFVLSFASVALGQDVVQVICSQSSIVARIQKQVVQMAQYEMENVHLNDKTCVFDQEDDEFYTREISPLTECGTHVKTNNTHVQFTNSISTVETGPTFPYGVVVGSQANKKVLSALISCTYRIDLNVSTMFLPNISIVVIQMPDAYGAGQFRAAMSIYTDSTYRIPYMTPPTMEPDDTLYIGTYLVDDASDDVYLLMEECWGTISSDPSATPRYPLIQDGCPVRSSADGLVRVTQNGVSHQGMWNSPVFKFVGEGEEFDNVWLHCNLQICINKQCAPNCAAKRKRRSLDSKGPLDFATPHIISLGPVSRVRITQINENETKTTYVDIDQPPMPEIYNSLRHKGHSREKSMFWNQTSLTIVGILGGLALLCVILGLIAVILRSRSQSNSSENSENFAFSGSINKGYAQ